MQCSSRVDFVKNLQNFCWYLSLALQTEIKVVWQKLISELSIKTTSRFFFFSNSRQAQNLSNSMPIKA
jgi:hypothetical protein